MDGEAAQKRYRKQRQYAMFPSEKFKPVLDSLLEHMSESHMCAAIGISQDSLRHIERTGHGKANYYYALVGFAYELGTSKIEDKLNFTKEQLIKLIGLAAHDPDIVVRLAHHLSLTE